MKLVILKSDAPLQYKAPGLDLILAGGCTINKVEDSVWKKVIENFKGNVELLQENGVLTVNDAAGSKNQNKNQDEELFQDLVDSKVKAQEKRKPAAISNDQSKGETL